MKESLEHRRLVSAYGKWFDLRMAGVGTICIRELTPAAAVEEAARRWGMEPEELLNCTIQELAE